MAQLVGRLIWVTDLIHSGHFSKTSNTPLTLRIFGLWDFRKNRQKWQRPHSIPQTLKIPQKLHIGMWRSLVSRSLWEREISQVRILSSRPIRNSRLIQSYRPAVFFLSLKISRKSLIYKDFFAFVVHFGVGDINIPCLGNL